MNEGILTSFVSLFELELDEHPVREVEVPLIQRDYAQGRPDERTTIIRSTFLDVLHNAATGGEPVGLDFVYGEVKDGTLHPLDGQQRLTVLFLLHWYVASRTHRIDAAASWTSFSYATRPSARLFCQRLAAAELPDAVSPSTWITDQAWYLRTWAHDPTVQSMLVVLDAIHDRFLGDDLDAAWRRLTSRGQPAISFHVLPISDMGEPEELYIKMNSRGRPLTEFENFKAQFERFIEHHERADEFSRKVDGEWSNLLWPLHGGDNLIDDEFLRYFEFVMEICEWRAGRLNAGRDPLLARAEQTFGSGEDSAENLDFLFHALNTWGDGASTDAYFERIFTANLDETDGRVLLFGVDAQPNLFEQCVRDYGNDQRFGIARRMLLYAMLLDRLHGVEDLPVRIRSLRNLLEASTDEIRPSNMPRIVHDVRALIVNGDLDQVSVLNAAQREDEKEKWAFAASHPEVAQSLHRLEDDQHLRGSLMAFELDHERLDDRENAWTAMRASRELALAGSGALLATGLYQRTIGRTMQFGPPSWSPRWRNLLTGTTRRALQPTRDTLMAVLDAVAGSEFAPLDALEALQAVVQDFLDRVEAINRFDWRYYLVKYPEMRSGASGIYRSEDDEMGYSICMLDKTQLNSYYRDPFLLAVVRYGDLEESVLNGREGARFYGGDNPRWLRLRDSGLGLRCTTSGFAVEPPIDVAHLELFNRVVEGRADVSVGEKEHQLGVPQVEVQGEQVDTADRVDIGARFLRACVQAGL